MAKNKPNLKYSKVDIDGKSYSVAGWVNTKYGEESAEAHQAKNEVISLINKFNLNIHLQMQLRDETLSPSEWSLATKFSVYRNDYGDHATPIGDASRNVVSNVQKPESKEALDWDDV